MNSLPSSVAKQKPHITFKGGMRFFCVEINDDSGVIAQILYNIVAI